MTSLEIEERLKQLARQLSETLQRDADIAEMLMPQARRRIEEKRKMRQSIITAWATPNMPVWRSARIAEKELADAIAIMSALELKRDHANMTRVRAHDYVATDSKGHYNCPQCWLNEHWTTAVQSLKNDSVMNEFQCPACASKFTLNGSSSTNFRARLVKPLNRMLANAQHRYSHANGSVVRE